MSSFPINLPTLKGSVLWKAMLRRCSTDLNNGVALVRQKEIDVQENRNIAPPDLFLFSSLLT